MLTTQLAVFVPTSMSKYCYLSEPSVTGAKTLLVTNKGRAKNIHEFSGLLTSVWRLSFYCNDDTIDVIPMAFLYIFFGEGGQPVIDFANVNL